MIGCLALVTPGEIFQLLCGQLIAVIFLVLQLWCAPYRTASNNFLAMAINFSLVLNFVSSIGVQVAAKYGIAAVDPVLLSIALYTAAFAVFPITLFTLLLAIRKPTVTPEQLRAYLLDDPDDEPNTSGPSAGVQLPPLIARFGSFSINIEDVTKALNAPLLSDHERRILTQTVSRVADGSRFASDPAALVFGQPREAALGIDPFLCVPPNQIRAGMAEGVVAIRREIEAAASTGELMALDTLECLDYVQHSRAGSSATVCAARVRSLAHVLSVLHAAHHPAACLHAHHPPSSSRFCSQKFPNFTHPRDCDKNGLRSDRRTASGDGMTLADFVAAPNSREAELEEAHVVALRLYTTRAFLLINIPLRDLGRHERGEAHPLPVTVAFLAEALRRLRAVGAKQANARSPVVLYRGLAHRTVPPAFFKEGGTEYAPMSTTNDLSVAVRYSASRSSVLLRMVTKSFIERGADISYLSAFPDEAEVLFPVRFDSHPCRASTCLQLSHSHATAPPPPCIGCSHSRT